MLLARHAIRIFICVLVLWPVSSYSGNTSQAGSYESLLSQYHTIRESLESNQYGTPVYIESDFQDDNATGEVFALVDHDFDSVVTGLSSPDHWCDVVLLHINVKGCDVKVNNSFESGLTLYVGRRYFQTPDQALEMQYQFKRVSSSTNYLHVNLTAGNGPFGTSDYLLTFEAIPISDSTSFIYFKYSYHYGLMAKLALDGYLTTFGRHKVGFTVTDYDELNNPIYVKGLQGIVERNSMRYFIAIRSFLDTYYLNREQWDNRIQRWYQLANSFEHQFMEIRDREYLETKRKEFRVRDVADTELLRLE